MTTASSAGQSAVDAIVGQFLNGCADVVMTLDHEGRIGSLIPAALQALDLPPSAPVEERLWTSLWNIDPSAADQGFETAKRDGRSRFDTARRTATRGMQWWTVTIFRISVGNAADAVWIVIANDISARIAASAIRKTSEPSYRALVLCGQTMTWAAAPDGTLTDAWGWDEMSGASTFETRKIWTENVFPADLERVQANWQAMLVEGILKPIEFRTAHPDGTYRWVQSRGVGLRDGSGAITEFVGTINDIHDLRSASEALREKEERLRLAIEATGLGIWQIDLPSDVSVWTPEFRTIMGVAPDVVVSSTLFMALVHPDDRAQVDAIWQAAITDLVPFTIVCRIKHDGIEGERWIQEWGRPSRIAGTGQVRIVGAGKDITEARALDAARASIEERSRLAFHAGHLFAWEWQLGSALVNRSEHVRSIAGINPGITDQACFMDRVHADDHANLTAFIQGTVPLENAVAQFRYQHPDGRSLWFETRAMMIEQPGVPRRIVGVTADVTDQKAAERSLLFAASHDALTGLLNRNVIQARLDRAIKNARRSGTKVALILLDIDHFKDVNDTLGHDAGDALLKVSAERLKGAIGRDGAVARLGGDEFAIVMGSCESQEEARSLGVLLLERLGVPFRYRGKTLQVRASIGIAVFPDHDRGRIKLLKDADLALYAAKNGGRNQVSVYESAMRVAVENRMALVAEMEATLDAHQIVPFYQPKIDLASGAIIGFEALARWIHPDRGILTAEAFAAAFANPTLAIGIDEAIARQVVRDIAVWQSRGLDCGRVAVNLSSFSFRSANVAQCILDDLAFVGVAPTSLQIEVTETVFLDGRADRVAALLSQFRSAGVKVSLDDFGTGYASLTHLKQFPVDEIKIDRSFIRDLEDDPQDAAIVSAIVGLAKALDLGTVAEGIETEGQAALLREWGCAQGQGYLYAKPMAASRVPWLLAQTFAPARDAVAPRGHLREGASRDDAMHDGSRPVAVRKAR